MECYVSNQAGRIPIFGYPLMQFSPPYSGRTITDSKSWRVATLGTGKVEYKEGPMDLKQISR